MSAFRVAILLGLLAAFPPSTAGADWLVTAFFGLKFSGDTTLVDLDEGSGQRKSAYGASVTLLTDGWVGAEFEVGRVPGFFQRPGGDLVTRSGVTTVTGNLVLAVPLRITRESLRPYATAGVGLLRATSDDVLDVFTFESDLWGLSLGGGAIGFFTERVGARFDLRYFKNIHDGGTVPGVGFGSPELSFWRFSIGLVIGY